MLPRIQTIPLPSQQNSGPEEAHRSAWLGGGAEEQHLKLRGRAAMAATLACVTVPKIAINIGGCHADDNYTMVRVSLHCFHFPSHCFDIFYLLLTVCLPCISSSYCILAMNLWPVPICSSVVHPSLQTLSFPGRVQESPTPSTLPLNHPQRPLSPKRR